MASTVVTVAGDQDVGVGVVRQTHHVHDDADVPVALVVDAPLSLRAKGLVDEEGFGADFVAEPVQVVDERAGRGGSGVVRLLLLYYVEGRAQQLTTVRGGGEQHPVVEDSLEIVLDGVVEVRAVHEDHDAL